MKKIKNYIAFIIIIISIYLLFTIKLPYYIEGPGDLININDRYKIEDEYKSKGSINMTFVSEYDATIPLYLYAKINKDYDILKKDVVLPSNESQKDSDFRGKIMLKEANDTAIIKAYEKAGKEYNILSQKIVVTYIEEKANTDLKIGDEIISVDGIKITSREELKKIITSHNISDRLNIEVKNNNKNYNKYGIVDKEKKVGFMFSYDRVIETKPKIEIKYKKDEFGPSGGLMTTLVIYNKLTEEDITHGKVISGTGTIEEDGSIGEIDGVKYKLRGAVKRKADIFFVPVGNYKEAKKLKDKYNYKIKLVKVKTFDDALKYLKKEV